MTTINESAKEKMRLLVVCFVSVVLVHATEGVLERLLRPGAPESRFGFCSSLPLPAASASDVLSKLQPFLEKAAQDISAALKEDNSPGGAVVSVVYKGSVIWTHGFGLINDSDPSRGAPDGDTAFRIGSITKVFTALMMLQLRDEGLLPSLDEDVTHFLPELKIKNPFQTKRGITFRQLSSHMSGLPREAPCPQSFFIGCNISYNKIYDNLAKMELMYPPGLEPQYSNLGFAVLGRTLEKIKGPTWKEQVQKMVLDPLGMTHSGNSFTPEVLKYLAVGYFPFGKMADLINLGFEAPAGQMFASSNDLAKLMKMLFRPEDPYNPDKGQILDGETITEWMDPTYMYSDGTGYGHPWELIPLGNYTLRTKGGDINGYSAAFQMAHEIKTGFIILQSCDHCTSRAKIVGIGQQILLEASRILWTMQPGPKLPPKPSEYVGVFSANVTPSIPVTINVTLGEVSGHQVLLATEETLGAKVIMLEEWVEGDTFTLSAQGIKIPCAVLSNGQIGERVVFQRSDSKITGLTIPGLVYGIVFRKTS